MGNGNELLDENETSTNSVVENALGAFSNVLATIESIQQKDPWSGTVLDRYEIGECIGKGTWGNVYKARNIVLDTDVAIKVIHQHVLGNEANIQRFHREARLLTCIQSNSVIKVIDADVTPVPYLVTEYFDGITLDRWLSLNGPMKTPMALDLFSQLCRGLAEAEAFGIVHRDLNPSNVLIKTYGDIVEARILDFGLAKCLDTDSTCGSKITKTGEIVGNPAYMAPEQFQGHADARSDIYSLACIMYEMLTGSPVFSSKSALDYMQKHLSHSPKHLLQVNPNVTLPTALVQLIHKCLEKSPRKRYQSAEHCRKELKAIKQKCKIKYLHSEKASGNFITSLSQSIKRSFRIFGD